MSRSLAEELGTGVVHAAEVLVALGEGVVDSRVLVVQGDRPLQAFDGLGKAPPVEFPCLGPRVVRTDGSRRPTSRRGAPT